MTTVVGSVFSLAGRKGWSGVGPGVIFIMETTKVVNVKCIIDGRRG